ncbi:MAG TPA: hypothetical protein VFG08_07030, partial [Candidatus Polarisedimenticolia bacterium]|nr:hypothetical protein [Candidatus Polarisedimenticolia bacterium]
HFYVAWQDETTFDWFNLYRGDLGVLVQSGVYTQDPGTVPLAGRSCGLTEPFMLDMPDLLPGQAVPHRRQRRGRAHAGHEQPRRGSL